MEAQTQRYVQLAIGWREAIIIFSNQLINCSTFCFQNIREKLKPTKLFSLQKQRCSLCFIKFHKTWIYKTVVFTLGLISMVRNSLKLGWGVRLWSFFSRDTSQLGARWTFFSMTQRPDLLEALMALSAWVNPSAEPNNGSNINCHQ